MNRKKLQSKPWYPAAVAACIAVVLYVVLTRPADVAAGLDRFLGYFTPVVLGCFIAYIVNPLSRLYERSAFRRLKNEGRREKLSNALAFVTVVLILGLLLLVSLPQLAMSIATFANNLSGYIKSLERLVANWELLGKLGIDTESLLSPTAEAMESVGAYLFDNMTKILNTTLGAGKGIVTFVLGFILSIYLLAEKSKLKNGVKRLMNAILGGGRSAEASTFLHRCDAILNRYIVFNIIDSLIVGVANAIFMLVTRMPYVGLVSFVVAVTNLIPTFGPVVGAVVGAFLLVLVKPWYALLFLAFTLVLQTMDGYILKPRLFGNSLGVSGLWIMVGVIVGGRMFGVIGILLAIPAVAILDYIYRDIFMPWLERRRQPRETSSMVQIDDSLDDIK